MKKATSFLLLCLCALVLAAPTDADARAGGGSKSMGSKGARTYQSSPAVPAKPIERSITPQQPATPHTEAPNMARPAMQAPMPQPAQSSSFFGGSFFRGMAGGLLGAGLFSMLFGHSSSMAMGAEGAGMGGGGAGLLGTIIQFALIGGLAYLAFRFFRNRFGTQPTQDNSAPYAQGYDQPEPSATAPSRGEPLPIDQADYQAFQASLEKIQTAWGHGDTAALRASVTPEMYGYFNEMLSADTSRGESNKVEQVQFLAGNLLESWREADLDFVTVRLKWKALDYRVRLDRAPGEIGYLVSGNQTVPEEAEEVWTFVRASQGGNWLLSAIQQVA